MIVNEDPFRRTMGWPLHTGGCGDDVHQDPAWVARQMGTFISFYALGCALTAPFAGWISDRLGRWKTIWIGIAVFVVGGVMQSAANGYEVLTAGRLVAGVSIGVLSMVIPLYIAELAPVHMRGAMVALQQIGITFGAMLSSIWCMIIQAIELEWGWRLEFGMQLILVVIMAVGMVFMPESPRWLVNNGHADKARALLKKLRGAKGEEATNREMEEIEEEAKDYAAQNGSWLELFSRKVVFATLVGCLVPIFQQLTGINAMMTQSSSIYSAMCLPGKSMTLVMNAVNFLATFGSIFTTDKLGRKRLLLLSSGAIFLFLMGFAGINWGINVSQNAPAAYGVLVLSYLYIIAFANAWGPLGWIIPAEVFPLRVRGKGVGLATFFNWMGNFAVTFITPIAINGTLGVGGYMAVFACLMGFIVAPSVFFLFPETKNVPLEEMEAHFDKPFGEYVRSNATDLVRRRPAQSEDVTCPDAKV